MNARLKRNVSLSVGAALIAQSLGCGSIMYPERRGYNGGPLDPGVVLLDGIGLLFFIIPGVIAFAVDISDGAIYLPHPRRHHYWRDDDPGEGMIKVPLPRGGDQMTAIENAVRAQTGLDVDLKGPDVRIVRLRSAAELPERFAQAPDVAER
jgi:hypothetical protein